MCYCTFNLGSVIVQHLKSIAQKILLFSTKIRWPFHRDTWSFECWSENSVSILKEFLRAQSNVMIAGVL